MGALDTNVLVYSEGLAFAAEDEVKVAKSIDLLARLTAADRRPVVPAQALIELHNVLVRRGRFERRRAAQRIAEIAENTIVVPTTTELISDAFELSARHNIPTFDAIILAAAAEARCDVLYSEDFQPGFGWRGVEVVNPFA